jgi:hypothetical protein
VTERFVVVTDVRGPFFDGLLETESAGANRYAIAVLQLLIEARFAVYEDLVGTTAQLVIDHGAVDDCEDTVVGLRDMCVVTGGARIIQDHRVVGRAPNGASGFWQEV